MKKVIILLLCSFCISTQADAQFGALKKLKQKMENKAAGALGKVLKTDAAPTQSAEKKSSLTPAQSSNNDEYTPEFNYAKWEERLYFDIEKANISDYDEHGEPILRIKQPTLHFKSTSEAIASIPSFPTTKQILNADNAKAKVDELINYSLALSEYNKILDQEANERAMKQADAALNNPQQQRLNPQASMPVTTAFMKKIEEAIAKSGLNLENASEEQIMKAVVGTISKEMGIPEAEMTKMMTMAQSNPEGATAYLKKNYPNAAKKFGLIEAETKKVQVKEDPAYDKLAELMDELSAIIASEEYKNAVTYEQKMQLELKSFANQLLEQWPSSQEYAKVTAMEKELQAKLNDYMEKNNTNYNDEAPAFWVEGRKAQNAIINAYNESIFAKWCNHLQECKDKLLPVAKKLADVSDRIHQLYNTIDRADTANFIMHFDETYTAMSRYSFQTLYVLPNTAMDAPRIMNVLEQWMP